MKKRTVVWILTLSVLLAMAPQFGVTVNAAEVSVSKRIEKITYKYDKHNWEKTVSYNDFGDVISISTKQTEPYLMEDETTFHYDDLGRLIKIDYPIGYGEEIYSYNDKNQIVSADLAYGNATYEYNQSNQLIKSINISDWSTVISNYVYDTNGLLTQTTDYTYPVGSMTDNQNLYETTPTVSKTTYSYDYPLTSTSKSDSYEYIHFYSDDSLSTHIFNLCTWSTFENLKCDYIVDDGCLTSISWTGSGGEGICQIIYGETGPSQFTDVPAGAWFVDEVKWAVANNITNGMTATTFAPDATCTRNQVVTFLWRAHGSPEPTSTENPFVDVNETDYFYDAVLWAAENGITTGMDGVHFDPNGECTRAQVVTFLHRAAEKPAPASTENPFSDVKEDFYTDAVLWAVGEEITTGITTDTFEPDSTCTRAQIVTFLYRYKN